MQRLGLIPREFRQPAHRITVDLQQPAGLANPASFTHVFQNGYRLAVRQAAVEQGRSLAFAESRPARAAIQQSNALTLAVLTAISQSEDNGFLPRCLPEGSLTPVSGTPLSSHLIRSIWPNRWRTCRAFHAPGCCAGGAGCSAGRRV